MFSLGLSEIILIMIVALVLFDVKTLTAAAKKTAVTLKKLKQIAKDIDIGK